MVYLDSSATTLKPQVVADAINFYYLHHSTNSHNNDSLFAHQPHQQIEQTRNLLAQLINANSCEEIIFTSGATESLKFNC